MADKDAGLGALLRTMKSLMEHCDAMELERADSPEPYRSLPLLDAMDAYNAFISSPPAARAGAPRVMDLRHLMSKSRWKCGYCGGLWTDGHPEIHGAKCPWENKDAAPEAPLPGQSAEVWEGRRNNVMRVLDWLRTLPAPIPPTDLVPNPRFKLEQDHLENAIARIEEIFDGKFDGDRRQDDEHATGDHASQ